MAAVTLSLNDPTDDTLPASAGDRRRVLMPSQGTWLRVRSAAEIYVERIDAADGSAAGTPHRTIPPGADVDVYIGRGECAVSGQSNSQVVTLTAVEGATAQLVAGEAVSMIVPTSPIRVARLPSLSPGLDPNSILLSAAQGDDGWIDLELDASVGDHAHLDVGASWTLSLTDVLGRSGVAVDAEEIMLLLVQVADIPDAGTGVVAVLSESDVTTPGSGIGLRLESDGAGVKPHVARHNNVLASVTGYEATIRQATLQLAANSAQGSLRAQSVMGYTAGGAYVDGAASLSALTGFAGLDRLHLGGVTPGGAGASSARARFRVGYMLADVSALVSRLPF